jgi:hypothetical protein
MLKIMYMYVHTYMNDFRGDRMLLMFLFNAELNPVILGTGG